MLLNLVRCNGKAWKGPEGSRRSRLPYFKIISTWRR